MLFSVTSMAGREGGEEEKLSTTHSRVTVTVYPGLLLLQLPLSPLSNHCGAGVTLYIALESWDPGRDSSSNCYSTTAQQ